MADFCVASMASCRFCFAFLIFVFCAANAEVSPDHCRFDQNLFAAQNFSEDSENLNINAAKSTIDKNNQYFLEGDVTVRSDDYFLGADKISLDRAAKILHATGDVKFQNQQIMATGDAAVISQKNDEMRAEINAAQFDYIDHKMHGSAEKITAEGAVLKFKKTDYTLCPPGNFDWFANADEIILDADENQGRAKNMTVRFMGVPIFYIPRYQWVLEGRGSGFLLPTIGTYSDDGEDGYQIKIPYYFNLAPDRDFLLTLNRLSTRGNVWEGLYRRLLGKTEYWRSGNFQLQGNYLDQDKISKRDRWLLNTRFDFHLNDEKSALDITTNRVSDKDYFRDIERDSGERPRLDSHLRLQHFDNDARLSWRLLFEKEQAIDDENDYTRTPELWVDKIYEDGKNAFDIHARITKFSHRNAEKIVATRTHFESGWERIFAKPAYELKPKINLLTTHYDLSNGREKTRFVPEFRLDGKYFLARDLNKKWRQSLTPRFFYHYRPDKNDDQIVNFDSEKIAEDYQNFFSGRQYTGLDLIEKSNDLTVALESEIFSPKTQNRADFKIAKNLGNDKIAALADFSYQDFTVENTAIYHQKTGRTMRLENRFSYDFDAKKFLTLAHHKNDAVRFAEIYGAWPTSAKTHIFAGINRSLNADTNHRQTFGFAYESCCWAFRAAHFKEHDPAGDDHRSVKIELVLKGFASTSPGMSKKLADNIPNYLVNLEE